MSLAHGVYTPPQVHLTLEGIVFNVGAATASLWEVTRFAGSAIGSAVVSYPARYARDAAPDVGKEARVRLSSQTIFRGVVGNAPFEVDPGTDEVQLVLYDDKWLMAAMIVGQQGVGTQGTPAGADGFKDVGFDLVFNRDGKPNKDPATRDFNTGSTAVLWTLKDILLWIFDYYMPSDSATISADTLGSGTPYSRSPANLTLIGQTGLQAVDTVVRLAGESWGLAPGKAISSFVRVRPNAGTQRAARMAAPNSGGRATDATQYHAGGLRVDKSVRNLRDVYQAVSGPAVKETTYSTDGADALLSRVSGFADPKYAARYEVDVTKYSANNLGMDLSSGARPKPWLKHLVTRLNAAGSAYLSAADISGNAALALQPGLQDPFVWVSLDGTEAAARLCTGGVRIDTENALLDFESKVELAVDSDDDPEEVTIESADWTDIDVWLTVATVLRVPQYVETDAGNRYLPTAMFQTIEVGDVAPERREDSWLPDLAGSNNAVSKIAPGSEETYVDIEQRLEDAIDAALDATPEIETPVRIRYPFMPRVDIGDRVSVKGRSVGLTGKEVVTEIRYRFVDGRPNEVAVSASNVMASMDPDQFVEAQ